MEDKELHNTTSSTFLGIETSFWNYSDHVILDDLKMDSNFLWLLCSLMFAIFWVIYVVYYNSRVIGYILTKLLNRFVIKHGYVKVGKLKDQRWENSIKTKKITVLTNVLFFCFVSGSFTLCALSGKIMFRDIVYITTDYSLRVQDGWLIFRWWRSYVPKDVSEGIQTFLFSWKLNFTIIYWAPLFSLQICRTRTRDCQWCWTVLSCTFTTAVSYTHSSRKHSAWIRKCSPKRRTIMWTATIATPREIWQTRLASRTMQSTYRDTWTTSENKRRTSSRGRGEI